MRLELGREADADFTDMLRYGAENFGWVAAEAYAVSLSSRLDRLASYPQLGMAHPELKPGLRSIPHGSHRIFYSVEGEVLTIRRILHKSRDVVRWLG